MKVHRQKYLATTLTSEKHIVPYENGWLQVFHSSKYTGNNVPPKKSITRTILFFLNKHTTAEIITQTTDDCKTLQHCKYCIVEIQLLHLRLGRGCIKMQAYANLG